MKVKSLFTMLTTIKTTFSNQAKTPAPDRKSFAGKKMIFAALFFLCTIAGWGTEWSGTLGNGGTLDITSPDATIRLVGNTSIDNLWIHADVTIDLNGYTLTVGNFYLGGRNDESTTKKATLILKNSGSSGLLYITVMYDVANNVETHLVLDNASVKVEGSYYVDRDAGITTDITGNGSFDVSGATTDNGAAYQLDSNVIPDSSSVIVTEDDDEISTDTYYWVGVTSNAWTESTNWRAKDSDGKWQKVTAGTYPGHVTNETAVFTSTSAVTDFSLADSAALTVNGSLVISGTTSIGGSSSLTFNGNVTNNGSIDCSNATVIFNGDYSGGASSKFTASSANTIFYGNADFSAMSSGNFEHKDGKIYFLTNGKTFTTCTEQNFNTLYLGNTSTLDIGSGEVTVSDIQMHTEPAVVPYLATDSSVTITGSGKLTCTKLELDRVSSTGGVKGTLTIDCDVDTAKLYPHSGTNVIINEGKTLKVTETFTDGPNDMPTSYTVNGTLDATSLALSFGTVSATSSVSVGSSGTVLSSTLNCPKVTNNGTITSPTVSVTDVTNGGTITSSTVSVTSATNTGTIKTEGLTVADTINSTGLIEFTGSGAVSVSNLASSVIKKVTVDSVAVTTLSSNLVISGDLICNGMLKAGSNSLTLNGADESNRIDVKGTGRIVVDKLNFSGSYLSLGGAIKISNSTSNIDPRVFTVTNSTTSADYATVFENGWNLPGLTYTWKGSASSSSWANTSNWEDGVVPDETGIVVYALAPASQPELTTDVTIAEITVSKGNSLSLNGKAFSVTDSFSNSGTIVLKGTETVSLPADATVENGTWHYACDGTGTVKPITNLTYNKLALTGTIVVQSGYSVTAQGGITIGTADSSTTISGASGTITFSSPVTVAGSSTFSGNNTFSQAATFNAETVLSGDNTFSAFTCETGGLSLTFAGDTTQTVSGNLTLKGADGNRLSLSSDSESFIVVPASNLTADYLSIGGYVKIKNPGTDVVAGSHKAYSVSKTSVPYNGTAYAELLQNGWDLGFEFVYRWVGGSSSGATLWSVDANWESNLAPGIASKNSTGAKVVIPEISGGNYPLVDVNEIALESLEIGTQAESVATLTFENTTSFTVTDELTNYGTIVHSGSLSPATGLLINYGTIAYSGTGRITDRATPTANPLNDSAHGGTVVYSGGTSANPQTVTKFSSSSADYAKLVISGICRQTQDISLSSINITSGAQFASGANADDSLSITVSGSWTNGGTFTANKSTVTFTGSTTVSGSTDFYDALFEGNAILSDANSFHDAEFRGSATLSDSNSFASALFNGDATLSAANTFGTATFKGNATFSASNSFTDFTCVAGGKTLSFGSGTIQSVSRNITLKGAAGNLLSLSSDSESAIVVPASNLTAAYLSIGENVWIREESDVVYGSHTAYLLDDKTSEPASGTSLASYYATLFKHGWNLGFEFFYRWKGEDSDNVWSKDSNWESELAPGLSSNSTSGVEVTIPGGKAYYPLVDTEGISVKSLLVGESASSDAKISLSGANSFMITDELTNWGTIAHSGSASISTGSLINYGTIAYSGTGRITDRATPTANPLNDSTHGGTVVYSGGSSANPQIVTNFSSDYANLVVSSNAILAGDIIVGEDFTATADLDGNGKSLTVNGTSEITSASISGAANLVFEDDFAFSGTVSLSASGNLTLASDASGSDDLSLSGNSVLLQGNLSTDGDCSMSGASVVLEGNLSAGGDCSMTGTSVVLKGNVSTLGSQNYSGAVTFKGDSTLMFTGSSDSDRKIIFTSDLTIDSESSLAFGSSSDDDYEITVAGNWTNGGSFTANKSTVTFKGADTILSGSTDFNDALFEGNATFSASNTFTDFTCEAGGATLTFGSGTIQSVSGNLTLKGTDGNLLSLSSAADSVLVVPASNLIAEYLSIGGKIIIREGDSVFYGSHKAYSGENTSSEPANGTDRQLYFAQVFKNGWNLGYEFDFVWSGAKNDSWSDDDNWESYLAPGLASYNTYGKAASIPGGKTNYPHADVDGITLESLEIGSVSGTDASLTLSGTKTLSVTEDLITYGSILLSDTASLSVGGTFSNYGTIEYAGSERITDGNSPVNDTLHGGRVLYSGGTSENPQSVTKFSPSGLDYANLVISGIAVSESEIEAGGNLSVKGGTLSALEQFSLSGDFSVDAGGTFTADKNFLFKGTSPQKITISSSLTAEFENLEISADSSLSASGSFTVTGNWTNRGSFSANEDSSILFSGNATTLTGNSDFYATVFSGTASILGNNSFHDADFQGNATLSASNSFNAASFRGDAILSAENTFGTAEFSGNATFSDSNTFGLLSFLGAGKTARFAEGKTQTVTEKIITRGSAGQEILLTGDGEWKISVPAENTSIAHTKIENSNSENEIIIYALDEFNIDGGENTNWIFAGQKYVWTGATDSEWREKSNWMPQVIPGRYSIVEIPAVESNNYPKLTEDLNLAFESREFTVFEDGLDVNRSVSSTLSIQNDAVFDFAGKNLSVNIFNISENSRIRMSGSENLSEIINKPDVASLGTFEYYGNFGTSLNWGNAYRELEFTENSEGSVSSAISVSGETLIINGSGKSITLSGANIFSGKVILGNQSSPAGDITLSGANTFASGVEVVSGGKIVLSGADSNGERFRLLGESACESLSVKSDVIIEGNVTTSGAQEYEKSVSLADAIVFDAASNSVSFDSTLAGTDSLTILSDAFFGGNVTAEKNVYLKADVVSKGNVSIKSQSGYILADGNKNRVWKAESASSLSFASDVYFDIDSLSSISIVSTLSFEKNLTVYSGEVIFCSESVSVGGNFVAFGENYGEDDPRYSGSDSRFAYPLSESLLYRAHSAFDSKLSSSGATLSVGGNFYLNGLDFTDFNLILPDSSSSNPQFNYSSVATENQWGMPFAVIFNSSVTNCAAASSSGNAFVTAALSQNIFDKGGNSGFQFAHPQITSAYSVSDSVLCLSFDMALENSNSELSNTISLISSLENGGIFYDDGQLAFDGVFYTQSDGTSCSVPLSESEWKNKDIPAGTKLYLKVASSEYRWNTDATGKSYGEEDSTDRSGTHRTRKIDLSLMEGLFYAAEGKTMCRNYGTGLWKDEDSSSYDSAEKYLPLDKARPVLTDVFTGQELHSKNTGEASSQKYYDSHNFIEFRYSEPVDIGDLSAGSEEFNQNVQAQKDFDSASSHGGAISKEGSGLYVAGFASFASGELVSGWKNGNSHESDNAKPHALYRKFSLNADSEESVHKNRIRISVAGYVDSENPVSYGSSSFNNWIGYIDSSKTPGGKVTVRENSYITDLAEDESGNPLKNTLDENNESRIISVNDRISDSPSSLYGDWDCLPPVFAPYVTNLASEGNSWTEGDGEDRIYEIVGTVESNTSAYLDKIEMHLFDNKQNYSADDEYRWISQQGWTFNGTVLQNHIGPETTGGQRAFSSGSNMTHGGLRRSSLASSSGAFTYVYKIDGEYSSERNFAADEISQNVKSMLFRNENLTLTSTEDDGLYIALNLNESDSQLPIRTGFIVTYSPEKSFITDLAGNRLVQTDSGKSVKTIKSVDITPPSFSITISPLGENKIYVVFTKPLAYKGQELSLHSDLDSVLEKIKSNVEFVYSDDDDIDTTALVSGDDSISVESVELAVHSDDYTALLFTLNRNIALSDVERIWLRVNDEGDLLETFAGVTVASYFQDRTGNSIPFHTCHAISDFAVNAVDVLYAYSLSDENEGWNEETAYGTGLAPLSSDYAVHDFSAEGKNYSKLRSNHDIVFQLQFEKDRTLELVIDNKKNLRTAWISDKFNLLTGLEWRIWLEANFYSLASSYNPSPLSGNPVFEAVSGSENLLNMTLSNADYNFAPGEEFQFFFKILKTDENGDAVPITINHDGDKTTGRTPLYAFRMPVEKIKAKDFSFLDLWSFSVSDITRQRGGISVLNNVINAGIGEKCSIEVDMKKSGSLNIYVMTLDGNIVKRLSKGTLSAGTHYFYWDGKNNAGNPVARGLYFIRVSGSGIDETRKVMVVK